PWDAMVMRLERKGDNPPNQNILLANNIYASSDVDDFTNGGDTSATLRNNLYWAAGGSLPAGDIGPGADPAGKTANPQLPAATGITLPVWNGSSFPGGSSIRQEFVRIAEGYARPGASSPALNAANPTHAPSTDILGRSRGSSPDLGAFER